MSNENPELDELVQTYLTIRREREILAAQFNEKDGELKADMSALEQVMLTKCNDINAESIRTSAGTIIKSMKETFVCGDWDNFKSFIIENNAVDLLQQRIHNTNFKEFMEQHQGEGLPPGISTMREVTVTVRKPTAK